MEPGHSTGQTEQRHISSVGGRQTAESNGAGTQETAEMGGSGVRIRGAGCTDRKEIQ